MNVPEKLKNIDFKGGLYAVTTDIDQRTDMDAMRIEVDNFLSENGFERDATRSDLGDIITTPLIKEILGYDQMGTIGLLLRKKVKCKTYTPPRQSCFRTYH